MSDDRQLTATTGRDSQGRFMQGNNCGRGNPHGQRVAQLRTAMYQAVTADDMQAVFTKLVSMAKDGDLTAAKLLLDRCFGTVQASIAITAPEPDCSGMVDYSKIPTDELRRMIANSQ